MRMDLRWGGDDINRIRALAQELVGSQPDIIVVSSTAATIAVERETRTLPIVFVNTGDPVASGIVPRLDRPSGNITELARFTAGNVDFPATGNATGNGLGRRYSAPQAERLLCASRQHLANYLAAITYAETD
jgi:hypothetical protein